MNKLPWVTNLRVVATLSVILLHAGSYGAEKVGKIPWIDWWICQIPNTFGRFAVPVFVMLSGYLLLGRYNDLTSFLSKRLTRVAVPFLIWTLFYIVWANFYGVRPERTPWEIGAITQKILTGGGGASYHLWFVYMLLGLYAITPVISRWILQATEAEIRFFLLLWIASSTLYPLVSRLFGFQIAVELRYFSGYIGYFVAGYWLGNRSFGASSWVWGLVFLLAWAATLVLSYLLSSTLGRYDSFASDYLSVNVILMSVSIFMFFKQACNQVVAERVVQQLDVQSYGIYLCHVVILRTLSRQFHLNYTWIHPAVGVLTQFTLCVVISFVLIWALSKIPKVGSWITG
ncbi:MAG: acyltransferase family protein [Spirosomataceae bacterium]